jgi:predicted phosphodiesterase
LPAAELDELLSGRQAQVMAGGHTHVQMIRQHGGRWLVNPGSTGMPFERYVNGGPPVVLPHAEYAIVEAEGGHVGVTLRRVELDKDELRKQLADWKLPMAAYLREHYR